LLGCVEYTTAIDIWSIGCICAELLIHKPLMAGDNDIDQIYLIFKLLGAPNERIWPDIDNHRLIVDHTINLKSYQEKYSSYEM
jgi:serine/threonine protein kinase